MSQKELNAMMELLDGNKHNLPENDYLQLCNPMKCVYDKKGVKESYTYMRFEYKKELFDILEEGNIGKLPFADTVIKFRDDELDDAMCNVESLIYDIMFEPMTTKTYMKIVERLGGKEEAHRKLKIYTKDSYDGYDTFMQKYRKQSKHWQAQVMAMHIIDKQIGMFTYVNVMDANECIDAGEFIKICREISMQ